MKPRSVPLIERKADVTQLAGDLAAHRETCVSCRPRQPCADAREIAADLKAAREDVAHWFDPGPDQLGLF